MPFFLPIILFYYSQKVRVTFILKRLFICGCIVQKVKYNPLVLSFAFEKKSFPKEKILFLTRVAPATSICMPQPTLVAHSDDLSTIGN